MFMLAASISTAAFIIFAVFGSSDAIDFDKRGVGCCRGNGRDLEPEMMEEIDLEASATD